MTEPLCVSDTPEMLPILLMMLAAIDLELMRFSVTVDPLVTTGATGVVTWTLLPLMLTS